LSLKKQIDRHKKERNLISMAYLMRATRLARAHSYWSPHYATVGYRDSEHARSRARGSNVADSLALIPPIFYPVSACSYYQGRMRNLANPRTMSQVDKSKWWVLPSGTNRHVEFHCCRIVKRDRKLTLLSK